MPLPESRRGADGFGHESFCRFDGFAQGFAVCQPGGDRQLLIELIALFRVDDLQHLLCEPLPYTGTIHVQHRDRLVDVLFDRDTPKTGVVTIVTDASTVRVELPIPLGGLCSGGQIPAPLDIDYASCGGCGNPVPPPGGPTDPIPPPPPID